VVRDIGVPSSHDSFNVRFFCPFLYTINGGMFAGRKPLLSRGFRPASVERPVTNDEKKSEYLTLNLYADLVQNILRIFLKIIYARSRRNTYRIQFCSFHLTVRDGIKRKLVFDFIFCPLNTTILCCWRQI